VNLEKKKYLNIGCGSYYSMESTWTNLDFASNNEHVTAHNLLKGIPFSDNSFDFVYHSHVLEHFSKNDGERLIKECYRVLKPGGILRVAIPDLEGIARNYISWLDRGIENPGDEIIRANYNWMLIEMYDQTVRNSSGGEMAKYIFQEKIINEDFIYERIGEEGKGIRNHYLKQRSQTPMAKLTLKRIASGVFYRLKNIAKLKKASIYEQIGRFRLGGEIHQWMYDRYSLSGLLTKTGFEQIIKTTAFNSYLTDWGKYNFDSVQGSVRKPDSLFIEARKA
jgi:predicted SAM-dependent methyltransferase